jgi:hypothetical protein
MTLRDTFSPGARMMPASREDLRAAGTRPFQRVRAFRRAAERDALRALAAPVAEAVLEPDESALAAWSYRLPPGGELLGPNPAGSGGQFWLVVGGEQAAGAAHLPPRSCTFVSADEPPYNVLAGPNGLDILALQFPARPTDA